MNDDTEKEITLYKNSLYYLTHNEIKCKKPIINKNGDKVPCHKCEICLEREKKEWNTRLLLEMHNKKNKENAFYTITFDNEHLIQDTSYRQVQLFFKRYRQYIKKNTTDNPKIKYFGVYENGDKKGRPHYHLLVFGHIIKPTINQKGITIKTANENLARLWGNGTIAKVKPMTTDNIYYLTDYIEKQQIPTHKIDEFQNTREWTKYNKYDTNHIVRQPFKFMSKGLGIEKFNEIKNRILNKGYLQYEKLKYKIPYFYKTKEKEINPEYKEQYNNEKTEIVNKEFEEYIKKYPTNNIDDKEYLENYEKLHDEKMLNLDKKLQHKRELKRSK